MNLRGRWTEFFQTRTTGDFLVFFNLVENAYSQPHRAYHNLSHIKACFSCLDKYLEAGGCIAEPDAIELAIWYHDLVYEITISGNEEKSANQLAIDMTVLKIPGPTVLEVQRLILLTKTHETADNDLDGQLMLDIDLSILGASQVAYQRYSEGISKEYQFIDSEIYKAARIDILKKFLARHQIYRTSYFFNQLEQKARRNIEDELISLGA